MKVGLVLAGGMAKGAYQVGALKAISEYFDPEDLECMSCASIGVLNGYAYATGKLDAAEQMWRQCCKAGSRFYINSILKGTYVQQSILNVYHKEDVLPCDLYAALLNINKRAINYTNLRHVDMKRMPDYLTASVAMPVYNRWVNLDGDNYYDGAMVDNIPVMPLLEKQLDYIICVYFDESSYIFEKTDFDDRIIKVMFKSNRLIRDSIVFDKNSIEDMISKGYDKTKKLLDIVFSKGTDNLDYIYDTIRLMNEESGDKKLRITGDFLVTNMNKIVQKLVNKKVKI